MKYNIIIIAMLSVTTPSTTITKEITSGWVFLPPKIESISPTDKGIKAEITEFTKNTITCRIWASEEITKVTAKVHISYETPTLPTELNTNGFANTANNSRYASGKFNINNYGYSTNNSTKDNNYLLGTKNNTDKNILGLTYANSNWGRYDTSLFTYQSSPIPLVPHTSGMIPKEHNTDEITSNQHRLQIPVKLSISKNTILTYDSDTNTCRYSSNTADIFGNSNAVTWSELNKGPGVFFAFQSSGAGGDAGNQGNSGGGGGCCAIGYMDVKQLINVGWTIEVVIGNGGAGGSAATFSGGSDGEECGFILTNGETKVMIVPRQGKARIAGKKFGEGGKTVFLFNIAKPEECLECDRTKITELNKWLVDNNLGSIAIFDIITGGDGGAQNSNAADLSSTNKINLNFLTNSYLWRYPKNKTIEASFGQGGKIYYKTKTDDEKGGGGGAAFCGFPDDTDKAEGGIMYFYGCGGAGGYMHSNDVNGDGRNGLSGCLAILEIE